MTIDRARVEAALGAAAPNALFHHLASTGSTNDLAREAARSGAPHGTLYLADEQTAGRGRGDHRWDSHPGENLTFSLVLRPRLEPRIAPTLALAVGLAVRAAAAQHTTAAITVKWPNDVVVGRKKLAGILVESQLRGMDLQSVVVGVGWNIRQTRFPDELTNRATSMALLQASELDRAALLGTFLGELFRRQGLLERFGWEALLPELRAWDALRGVAISVEGVRGEGAGLAESGALLLRRPDGRIDTIHAGSIEFLDV